MMLGEKELVKLFPDFADLVQPSGIDLELDKVYIQKAKAHLLTTKRICQKSKRWTGTSTP